MNHFRLLFATGLALVSLLPPLVGKTLSDLVSPDKRRTAVELAQRLTHAPEVAPAPTDLPSPFNPPGFDQPDPEEARAAAAAYAKGVGPAPAVGAGPASTAATAGGSGSAGQPAHPPGEREILETLAGKLPATGTFVFNGEPLLVVGRNRVKVGDKFTVAYNGQDYELELITIDRTTFTLRYHGEEITRPIKTGK